MYFIHKRAGEDLSKWENDPAFMKRLNSYQEQIAFYKMQATSPSFDKNQTWRSVGAWDSFDKNKIKQQKKSAEEGTKFFNPETFDNGLPTQWWDFDNKQWVEVGSELMKYDVDQYSNFKLAVQNYLDRTGKIGAETSISEYRNKTEQYTKYMYSGVNTYFSNYVFDLVNQDIPQFASLKEKNAFLETHEFKNHQFNDLSYRDGNGNIVKTEDQYIPYMNMYNKTQLHSEGDPFVMIDSPEKALQANLFNLISGPFSKNVLGFKTKMLGFGFDLEKVPQFMPWLKEFPYDELDTKTNTYVRKYVANPEYNPVLSQWSENAQTWIDALGPTGDGNDGYLLNNYNQDEFLNMIDFTDTEAMFGYKKDEDGNMVMRLGTANMGQYNTGTFQNNIMQGQNLSLLRSDLIGLDGKKMTSLKDDEINSSNTNLGEISLYGMAAYSAYQLWKKNPLMIGADLTFKQWAKNAALQPIRWGSKQFQNSLFLNTSAGGLYGGTSGLTVNNALLTGFGYSHGKDMIKKLGEGKYWDATKDAFWTGLNVAPGYGYFNRNLNLIPNSNKLLNNTKLWENTSKIGTSAKYRMDMFNEKLYNPWNNLTMGFKQNKAVSGTNRFITMFPNTTSKINNSVLPISLNPRPTQYSIMSDLNKGDKFGGKLNYNFSMNSPLWKQYNINKYNLDGKTRIFNPSFSPKPLQIGTTPLGLNTGQPVSLFNADGSYNVNYRMQNITNPGKSGFTMPNNYGGLNSKPFDNMIKPVDGGFITK